MRTNIATKTALALALGLLSFQSLTRAEEPAGKDTPRDEQRAAAFRQRMKEVAEKLGLTEEQKEKIRPIIRAEMEKFRELRKDQTLSREDKIKKLQAIREDIAPKLKPILTAEQFEKWQKIAEERRARWQQK